ncbi:zinc finger protein 19-like isoform X1 [Corapipo altera]|uniref:zinc finger protein 19-like isoform X1 n=1 Tax=Corapipo altera TaxID=415028 RepID=UPI000FD649FD|nr:zinc finger protein 19-like isoform X1 [Corapipo altera]
MVYCAALNCRNATSGSCKNSSVTFHGFPLQNEALLKQWIQNMGRDMGTPSKYERLCSAHFEESSFEGDPLKIRRRRRLLKEAVPNKFILGQDGNWLVGTPQGFCDGMRNKTRKRIRNPEHQRVPGKCPNGAKRPTLEDWQNEFCKTILKENYGSLTVFRKDYPVPKSKIPVGEMAQVKAQQGLEGRKIPASLSTGHGGATIRSQQQSAENTQVHGSPSGGSQNQRWNVSDKGETRESQQSSTNQAKPPGNRRGSSFPAGGQLGEFRRFLFQQQTHPKASEVPWFICTECGKSFARHTYLLRHRRIHSGVRPHTCLECGKSFLEKPKLISHWRTHFHIICVPNDFLG